MAKKNLANLMNGLISTPSTGEAKGNQELITAPVPEPDVVTKQPGRGRPSKHTSRQPEIRTTMLLDKTLLNKLRYVALIEGRPMKEIVSNLIEGYVADWERAHGSFPDHIKQN